MYRILTCVTTAHDLRLVPLAALICAVATFTSFRIYARAVSAGALQDQHHRGLIWLGLTGLSTGAGIWSTHFVAMLAYDSGVPTAYDPALTLTSLVIAIGVTTMGYLIAASDAEPSGARYSIDALGFSIAIDGSDAKVAVGGAIVGVGIGLMHYTGMAAVIVPGVVQWEPMYVVASLGLGIVFASASMVANRRLVPRRALWIAPGLLTLAVCSLHFTAMASAIVVPDPTILVDPSVINTGGMAIAVTGVTILTMLAAVSAAFVSTQREVQNELRRNNEVLQQRDRELEVQNAQLARQHTLLNQRGSCLQAIIDNFPGGIIFLDADLRLAVANERAKTLLDFPDYLFSDGPPSLEDVFRFNANRGEGPGDVDDHVAKRIALARAHQPHVFERERPNGTVIEVRGVPLADGGFVTTYMDVTQRHRSEAKINHMAHHDALTDLPNRVLLRERLEQGLKNTRRGERYLAVLTLDLDRFKEINDTLGHPIGDELLKCVADRLRACIRETSTIARLGGDEFAIVEDVTNPVTEATAVADRIQMALSTPFELSGHQVIIGSSIGIAIAPDDGSDPDNLLKNADLALYRAKNSGRGMHCFFEREMDRLMQARRDLERDLRSALTNDEFELHYQPVVDIETRQKVGMEALVRWRHPQRGMIMPDRFISLAEETGLIKPMGEWVLRQACADAVAWPTDTKVSVNLSPIQFQATDFAGHVAQILADAGLPPERLELEITESVLLHRSGENIAILHKLRGLGVSVALDDFGTGYSSLSYLRTFPFDQIKIDKSFISEMSERDECAAIVCAVANLGRSLNIGTTAEGVETEEQVHLLRAAGCTHVQGYLFGRPGPVAALDFDDAAAHPAAKEHATLTARDIMLVRSSFSQVVPIQETAAHLFYDRLFAIAPELRVLFPADLSEQKRKLMAMLAAGIGKLHDFSALTPMVKDLGARHAAYGTNAEHYIIVGDALLWTLEKGLGDAFTPETRSAWTKVYDLFAATMQAGARDATAVRAA